MAKSTLVRFSKDLHVSIFFILCYYGQLSLHIVCFPIPGYFQYSDQIFFSRSFFLLFKSFLSSTCFTLFAHLYCTKKLHSVTKKQHYLCFTVKIQVYNSHSLVFYANKEIWRRLLDITFVQHLHSCIVIYYFKWYL